MLLKCKGGLPSQQNFEIKGWKNLVLSLRFLGYFSWNFMSATDNCRQTKRKSSISGCNFTSSWGDLSGILQAKRKDLTLPFHKGICCKVAWNCCWCRQLSVFEEGSQVPSWFSCGLVSLGSAEFYEQSWKAAALPFSCKAPSLAHREVGLNSELACY